MQFSFAFFANVAEILRDGRILAIGMDIEGIICPQFPITVPLILIVKIKLDPSEINLQHKCVIEITRPNGKREPLGIENPFDAKANPMDPNLPGSTAIIVTMGTNFDSAGEHLFHILIDGEEVKSLPLDVRPANTDIKTNTPELTDKTP